jgi:hypothetical protein
LGRVGVDGRTDLVEETLETGWRMTSVRVLQDRVQWRELQKVVSAFAGTFNLALGRADPLSKESYRLSTRFIIS